MTPGVSVHIPWDRPESASKLTGVCGEPGLFIDSTNSNTFQDQPGQTHSYKFGSLSHTDKSGAATRPSSTTSSAWRSAPSWALAAHTVWIGDGGNFPGQVHSRRALERYLESLREDLRGAARRLPAAPRAQALRAGVLFHGRQRLGHELLCARALGDRAFSLVDLGHHAPSINIEQMVARLIQLGKLGGFHFNDSKYGDDDLDAGIDQAVLSCS